MTWPPHTLGNELTSVTATGNTPLHWTAANGHPKAMALLLAYGAGPSVHMTNKVSVFRCRFTAVSLPFCCRFARFALHTDMPPIVSLHRRTGRHPQGG